MFSSIIKTNIKNINQDQINKEYNIYFFFVTLVISLQLICNTIEPIIMNFSSFKIPASALFYVFSFALSDILTENFGFKLAVRATMLNTIAQLFYCGIAAIVFVMLKYSQNSSAIENYRYIFSFLSLELISSIVSLLVSMISNDYLINRLKLIFLGKGFWWRTIVSTITGEIVMLNIDYNISFHREMRFLEIQNLIFSAMLYKVIAAVLLAYPATLLSAHIGRRVILLKPAMDKSNNLLKELKNAFIFR